jgi:hypothetical protein
LNNKTLKGLLFSVVLFSLFYACQPPLNRQQETAITTQQTIEIDTSIPNATQYLLFGSNKEASDKSDTLSKTEINLLQDGDILLRKGYGAVSDYIADFLKEKYAVTHCGFIVNSNSSNPNVLHTISNDKVNGMFLEPLGAYAKQSQWSSLVVVRLKSDSIKIKAVLAKANDLLKQKIPFDMGFNDKNSETLFCLEMMRNVFLEVYKKDLISKRCIRQTIDVLSMDNFFDSTNFEVIINHFE